MSLASFDYAALFAGLPEAYILLRADTLFTIADVNDAHLALTGAKRKDLIGVPLLAAFPDTSEKYKRTGVSDLEESMRRAVKTKASDTLRSFRYDIPDRKHGGLLVRYWQPVHYPIMDSAGNVTHVLQVSRDVTAEHLTSRKLKDSQIQLTQALAAGLIGIWSWDIKANKVIADKNLARMFGVSAKEASTGLPIDLFTSAIYAEDRERVLAEIEHAIAKKSHFEAEYRTANADGELRWVIARGKVEPDTEGNPAHFPGVLVDITDRKQAEEKLLESVQNFQNLANAMPQLIWVTRPDGYHEYYNKHWYDYTGKSFDETKGTGWNGVLHPDDQEFATKVWHKALKTGEPYQIQYRLRAADGQYRWFMGRALPARDSHGTIVRWYGTCTDIDEQRRTTDVQRFLSNATKVLASSLEYKKTLTEIAHMVVPNVADWCSVTLQNAEGTAESIVIAHKDPAKVKLAQKFQKMNARLGDPAFVRMLERGEAEYFPEITEAMLQHANVPNEQLEIVRKLGIHSSIAVPLKSGDKAIGLLSLVQSDNKRNFSKDDLGMAEELADRISLTITNAHLYQQAQNELQERTRLEERLKQANEELEARVSERTRQLEETNQNLQRSNQELQDFAYVASHDLQEPLRKIQAFGNLLEEEYGDKLDDGAMYLERMRSAASRMSTLIQDLLSFSRVTTTARPFKPVDLNVIAAEVISDLEARIADVNAHVAVGQLPTVMADPTQMRQLLQNLISNALKFSKPNANPTVKVTAATKKKAGVPVQHIISVSDEGIGFDEKYLDRIFAVFQRLHTKESYQGTGIGLAICRKIAERHGGSITARSAPDSGSTFIVTLPAKREDEGEHHDNTTA